MRVYEHASTRWEIELHGERVVARRYLDGVLVDDSPMEHSSPLRAKWEADKLCARLAANGYERVADDAPVLGKRELEDALRANPDDLETYLVYADWLSEHGDDWGQLIAVQHALLGLRASPRRDELERNEVMLRYKLGARLWGRLGETIHNESTQTYLCDLIEAEWQCGFLRSVEIRRANGEILAGIVATLNELPIALVLREITIRANEWEEGAIEALANRSWPLVERVSITGRVDATRIAPLLVRHAPALRHVEVIESTGSDALLFAIADGPLAPQLESVVIRAGEFSSRGIDKLASAKFRSLAKLELGGVLPNDTHAKLKSLAPTVRIFEEQQRYDDY